jgi:outer membrane lipoprotein-sorting protein
MTSRDQQQADLLQAYRAALAHDPDASPPAALDPLYAQMARGLERLRPPAPDPATRSRLRTRIEREMTQATATRGWGAGIGGWRFLTKLQPLPIPFVLAAVIVLAVAAGLLAQAVRPRGVSAAEVIERARSAEGGFHSFVVTETAEARAAGAPAGSGRVRSEITRWYEAPGRWRREVASLVIGPDGQAVRGTGLTSVSDGDTVWIYRAGDNVVMVRPFTPDGSAEEIGPFPEVTGGLAPLLDQVTACYTPQLRGRDSVAGRTAFVIDLGRSHCPADAEAGAQPAGWTVWVDTETYLILKSVQMLDGTPVYTSTVTNVQYNVPIDPARFAFALPAGARVRDARPGR